MSKVYKNELGYLDLIKHTIQHGVDISDRTGVGCRAIFDAKVVFDEFPLSTVRPAGLKLAFEEMWMFLRGSTQTKELEEKGINFWKGNTSREFLDHRGLNHLEEGDMGKAYGYQFRNASGKVDQLRGVYESLRNDRYGRRHYVTLWNPAESDEMALTPCWHSHQFVVLPDGSGKDVLHLKLLNRSLDSVYGFTYAVQQYRLYQECMAKLLGFEVGNLSCDLTHVHIYSNQLDFSLELSERDLGTQGKVTINKELNILDDMISLMWDDIDITGLEVNRKPFTSNRPPMAV